MAVTEKRVIRREITQRLCLPLDSESSIEDQCKRTLVMRLHGVPSAWGVMVDDHLLSITVGEHTVPISYGTKVFLSVLVKAVYEVVGYNIGDVLLGVSLADKLADDPIINQFRRVDILGLPFQIDVKTRLDASVMNVQIVDSRIEGALQYISVPAFYPYYTPLCAHLASTELQSLSLYAESPMPVLKPPPNDTEWKLIDPLFGMPDDMRRRRVVAEVRRVLGILPSLEKMKETGTAASQAKKPAEVHIINSDALNGKEAVPTLDTADAARPVMIEFIDVRDVRKKVVAYAKAQCRKYTFVRVPSIPVLSSIVAAVSWHKDIPLLIAPTDVQVEQFERDVLSLIKFHHLEMASNRNALGLRSFSEKADSPESRLIKEYFEAAEKIRKGLAIEMTVSGATKAAEERKSRQRQAMTDGMPLPIAMPVIARGRGRGSRGGGRQAPLLLPSRRRGRGRGLKNK